MSVDEHLWKRLYDLNILEIALLERRRLQFFVQVQWANLKSFEHISNVPQYYCIVVFTASSVYFEL